MRVVALLLLTFASASAESPIGRVVQIIEGLKAKINADGKAEQQVYDKYACWCEKTTARKAASIEDGKTRISELSENILKLKGRLGSFVAELNKLKKDIASNKESTAKADEMRSNENAAYVKKKGELEQGIANLKKAVEVLTGGTTGFTPAMMETRMLTVAAGVRNAMKVYGGVSNTGEDLSAVKSFLSNPGSWAQIKANPATQTYNHQSGAIQGILSQMLEDFETELTNSAAEEETAAGDYDNLKATKARELSMLEATLTKKNSENGSDTKQLADDSEERSETESQLKIDEEFFETTKDGCKKKADEWSERSRLRTEELAGISQAIDILTSDEAQATFASSDSTFVQLSQKDAPKRTQAYNLLKTLATKTDSLRLAAVASTVYTSGHFDSVIADITKMIQNLRDEEKADEDHRDWCETERANANSKNENLEYDKEQLQKKVERLEGKKTELENSVAKTEAEIADTKQSMEDALENRNTENESFKQALKDDSDAVMLIAKAIEALSKFYENNAPALLQKPHSHVAVARKHGQPEYKGNEDTAPETFGKEGYGGRSSENTGIVAILSMIKEDIQNEMKVARKEEKESADAFFKLAGESHAAVKAMKEKVTALNTRIAETMKGISDTESVHDDKANSKDATDAYIEDLKPNCDWVDRTFDTRREKRKAEIDGLQNAKSVLAGAGAEAAPGLLTTSRVAARRPSVDDELKQLDATEQSYGITTSFLQKH